MFCMKTCNYCPSYRLCGALLIPSDLLEYLEDRLKLRLTVGVSYPGWTGYKAPCIRKRLKSP
ncbi:hypothetical protein DU62_01495 [Methanosarcina mazei]|uniref:Uncharacterized protein n=1 Tax=Methanosarcina mazei TaxID=2209 RepID=A0A0F8KJD4_METMZ|nr:hypothetical protein DU34_05425 [Methanosarcina mazei]KKG75377.1 hypothetical protein DU46_02550 [Methanosarcina mazei]KKG86856.1 hypothetical protein DU61_19375 [Methanosarcina mazei]KKH13752.1 hypothetical protein DU62_01495 [Methanosarcina mazei]